ncbi:vWA domain-containing protein [Fervidobacterium islandicum]|uniref:vWA domain-containing protein n=1 Tax=Fervidobacterium islandicum TaxID=2423 RepID=UPI003A6C8E69
MDKKLIFTSRFYKPYISSELNSDVENILYIEIKPNKELAKEEFTVKSIDFCIVLDVSGSMDEYLPGRRIKKLDAAIDAAKRLYDFLTPDDTVSIILYDSSPHVVMNPTKNVSRNDFNMALEKGREYGGSTNISAALREARKILTSSGGEVKRIVFLTDGLPTVDREEDGYMEAQMLAEHRIVVTALGIGHDFNYKYIEQLAAYTRGSTDHIQKEEDAVRVFTEAFARAKSTVAKNVTLRLKFSDRVRVADHYRASPQITYLGKLQLDNSRKLEIKLDDIEFDKKYDYLFEITIPQLIRKFEGPFKVGEAELEYEIPALRKKVTEKYEFIVEATSDPSKTLSRYESVNELHARCFINKLDGKMNEALSRNDKETAARILREIIQKAESIGDYDLRDTYKRMLEEFVQRGVVSSELRIAASHRSTRVSENFSDESETIDPDSIF